MDSLTKKPHLTSVEEAIDGFDTEVNNLLLQTTDEIQKQINDTLTEIKSDESIRKRSVRRHVLAKIKETIFGKTASRNTTYEGVQYPFGFGLD